MRHMKLYRGKKDFVQHSLSVYKQQDIYPQSKHEPM